METKALDLIQQEVCELFGWNKPNILVRTTALVIERLHTSLMENPLLQAGTPAPETTIRQETVKTSLDTLKNLLGYENETAPDAGSAVLYEKFRSAMEATVDAPIPDALSRGTASKERLTMELVLWRQLQAALHVCAFVQKVILIAQKMTGKPAGNGTVSTTMQNKPGAPASQGLMKKVPPRLPGEKVGSDPHNILQNLGR